MRFVARMLRVVGWSLLAATLVVALGLVGVNLQARLLRSRIDRFLTDYNSLRVHRSSDAEVRSFVRRWGQWGYAVSPCSSQHCEYQFKISDWLSRHLPPFDEKHWIGRHSYQVGRAMMLFEYHEVNLTASVTVDQYQLEREALWLTFGGSRIITLASPSLGDYGYFFLDNVDSSHPAFAIWGTPCAGCIRRYIHYTPEISERELYPLQQFDTGCLTSLRGCQTPDELLPGLRSDHRYQEAQSSIQEPPRKTCPLSTYVMARDNPTVLKIKVLERTHKTKPDGDYTFDEETDRIDVESVLKTLLPNKMPVPNEFMPATSTASAADVAASTLTVGHEYFLFPFWSNSSAEEVPQVWNTALCGIVPVTSQTEAEVRRGMQAGKSTDSREPLL